MDLSLHNVDVNDSKQESDTRKVYAAFDSVQLHTDLYDLTTVFNKKVDTSDSRITTSWHHRKLLGKLMAPVPSRLMPDTVREIYDAFSFFDLNANGHIEANELKRVLNALYFKKTEEESQDIINYFDLDGNQLLDFHEVIFAVARHIKHDVFTLADIQQRFNKFDEDQDGKLTVNTIPNLIRKGFGIPVSDKEIFDLLSIAMDITDETARLSFEKLIRMLQHAVNATEKADAPDFMRKLRNRCGPAVRNIGSNDIKLMKKRMIATTMPNGSVSNSKNAQFDNFEI
ncbi:unnamed protein product [Didymodactylos carnosus]|uniref:EF-hand domain-containing protein n=1 Tax=Didymodactylos carnosus TaxID=1234261 RepID=A0A814AXF0_9BILA|nr:unnamed protein product [Didymodactylos carnosus]CAF1025723.1 unnamed protein product [Didymodactylos carnosus]CAF3699804.1 unnamed protein product [Didymodactylos carnosus]CAF3794162.1 unnamed protein product [Didymodactylos carnosus]